jgi:DNA polymerase III alpha subunit
MPINTKDFNFIKQRSVLINNMEVILESLSSRRENKKIESDDLFDFGGQEEVKSNLNLDYDIANLPDIDILMAEKDSLGLYVSGNPIEALTPFVDYLMDFTYQDGLHLVLIEKIRKIFTRTGKLMLAIDITTNHESNLEMVIFPKHAGDLVKVIEAKQLFWAVGKIQEPKQIQIEASVNSAPPSPAEISENSNENSPEINPETSSETATENPEPATAPTALNEYVDKKKLLIDWLVPYDSGILGLLEHLKIPQSERQVKLLSKVNYTKIVSDPTNWDRIIQSSIDDSKTKIDTTHLHTINHIQLRESLGSENLKVIKDKLQKTEFEGATAIKISLEHKGIFKELPQTFFVTKVGYDEIKLIIEK